MRELHELGFGLGTNLVQLDKLYPLVNQVILNLYENLKVMKIPTDLQILSFIYDSYYKTFESFTKENKIRETKNYVPINIDSIGEHFNVDGDIVFGRLYYHLNKKYNYKKDDGTIVDFFRLRLIDNIHCVHFPYMASVLADLKYENKKYRTATVIALVSLGISFISISISLFLSIL